jgi:hypothetical protein
VDDDELVEAWERGEVFSGGISHEQHLRIAWGLLRRHDRREAVSRLVAGTERACHAHGVPEKFNAALTERWADAVAERGERGGFGQSADDFLARNPDLLRSDLIPRPSSPA